MFISLGVLNYVCVRSVMDVVFSVCIVTRGAVGTRVWELRVFRHVDVCLSCGSSQWCIRHDLQFVNGRGILQSRSHDCLIGIHERLLLFTPSCCCEWLVCLY